MDGGKAETVRISICHNPQLILLYSSANEAMDTGGSNVGIANKPHITSDTTNKPMEAYKDTGDTAVSCNKLT